MEELAGLFGKPLKEVTFRSMQCSWHVLNLLVFEALCSYTVCSYKKKIVYFFFHKVSVAFIIFNSCLCLQKFKI